jgi:hypothetical protein
MNKKESPWARLPVGLVLFALSHLVQRFKVKEQIYRTMEIMFSVTPPICSPGVHSFPMLFNETISKENVLFYS